MIRSIQDFHVGIKAFIFNGDRLLKVKGNYPDLHWELPGRRVDVGEELLPADDILHREISEELGPELKYSIGRPVATWSRLLPKSTKYVYLIGFICKFINGEIKLSGEHSEYRWVDETESRQLELADGYDRALDQFWKSR